MTENISLQEKLMYLRDLSIKYMELLDSWVQKIKKRSKDLYATALLVDCPNQLICNQISDLSSFVEVKKLNLGRDSES